MKELNSFQTRTAYTVLVGIIASTIRKLPRFNNIPEEDVVSESFKSVVDKVKSV